VSGRTDKKKMEVKTAGGIPIKPFYTLHDMENHDFKEIEVDPRSWNQSSQFGNEI
jgi:hypothetical protein